MAEFKRIMKQMKKNKMAMLGLIIFLIELILLVLAPVIIPYDYTAMDIMAIQQGPSAQHWFGTDELGSIGERFAHAAFITLGLLL